MSLNDCLKKNPYHLHPSSDFQHSSRCCSSCLSDLQASRPLSTPSQTISRLSSPIPSAGLSLCAFEISPFQEFPQLLIKLEHGRSQSSSSYMDLCLMEAMCQVDVRGSLSLNETQKVPTYRIIAVSKIPKHKGHKSNAINFHN